MPPEITDEKLDNRITLFIDQPKNECAYRVALQYFTDIGKINFPLKIYFKITCHLETDLKTLFESKKRVTVIGAPNANLYLLKLPLSNVNNFYSIKVLDST